MDCWSQTFPFKVTSTLTLVVQREISWQRRESAIKLVTDFIYFSYSATSRSRFSLHTWVLTPMKWNISTSIRLIGTLGTMNVCTRCSRVFTLLAGDFFSMRLTFLIFIEISQQLLDGLHTKLSTRRLKCMNCNYFDLLTFYLVPSSSQNDLTMAKCFPSDLIHDQIPAKLTPLPSALFVSCVFC